MFLKSPCECKIFGRPHNFFTKPDLNDPTTAWGSFLCVCMPERMGAVGGGGGGGRGGGGGGGGGGAYPLHVLTHFSLKSTRRVAFVMLSKRFRLEDDEDEMLMMLMVDYKRRKEEEQSTVLEVVELAVEAMEAYCKYRGGLHEMRVFDLPFVVSLPPSGMGEKMFRFLFRWDRKELAEACRVLRVPEVVKARNGDKAPGIDVFCMMSMKFAFPTRLGQLIPFFGFSISKSCRLIAALRLFLFSEYAHKLSWLPNISVSDIKRYCAGIESRTNFPICFGFVDGTVRPVCKPGLLQGELYCGKDRVHSLKYQGFSTPDGILQQLCGPWPGRRHDQVMYSHSGLPEWLDSLPRHESGAMYCIYADQGYHRQPGLMVPFSDAIVNMQHEAFNDVMSGARIAVEWEFGGILHYWASLRWTSEQKAMAGGKIAQVYFVCGLLTNCLNCLRRSNASTYFDVKPPTLEEYVHSLTARVPQSELQPPGDV